MSHSGFRITAGAVLAGLAVICGAFAAHGLDSFLIEQWGSTTKTIAGHEVPASWKYMQDFKTGAEYQMYHALALIALGLCSASDDRRAFKVAAAAFITGTVLFSGSLYLLVLTKQTWLGAIVPLGGVAFIVGWIAFATGASRKSS